MSQVSGYDIAVVVYDETEYGVDPDPADGQLVCFTRLDIQPNEELVQDPTICYATGGRGVQRPGRAGVAPSGNISVAVAYESIGFWLKHLLGTPTTTGAGPYTHTYVPAALPVGFVVEKDYTDALASKVERFTGCRIDTGVFTFPSKGFVTLDLGILGKDHIITTAVLDATPTAVPGHTPFTNAHITVQEGGSDLCVVTSGVLNIANNLDPDNYNLCSGGTRAGAAEGECAISGTLEAVFSSFDQLDKAYASTETTIQFALVNGSYSLTLLVDHADFTRSSPIIETKRGMMVTLPFTGFASGSDLGLEVVLVNANSDEGGA